MGSRSLVSTVSLDSDDSKQPVVSHKNKADSSSAV